MRRWYVGIAWLAMLWALGNCLYVYVFLRGARAFRIESAVFILAGVLVPLLFWRPSQLGRSRPLNLLSTNQNRVLTLAAIGLWLFTLAPLLAFPFLSDDYVFLGAYRRWSDVLDFSHFFRPLFAAVFLFLARLGGLSALPFHVASLVLHFTSSWFVYVLARRLFVRADAAVLCFAIFLLNPLQLEAVLWASGLQELLWTVLVLGALVVYTGTTTLSSARMTATAGLLGAALLAKETAVSSFLLMPVMDWAYFKMKRGRLLAVAYIVFALETAAYLAARARGASIESTYFVTPGAYFAKQFIGTPYKFFVQPWNLSAALIPTLLLCAAAMIAIALLFRAVLAGVGPSLLAGPLIILVSTLPVYSYFYVAPDLRGARYVYFAAFGWSVLTAQIFTSLTSRRILGATLVGLIFFSFASLLVNLGPWRTAGDIVASVEAAIKEGQPPETFPAKWRDKYGPGLESKDGVPNVYKGVYLFVNGYPELRAMLAQPGVEGSRAIDRPDLAR